ncbi:NAD(P)H-binding protein [Ferrimonas lipolytica]|uniref:NAD(P)H-binding protein n=1 Tax=Ferrimonas lipolytica TaxID=2724191 RepID=A0A6H1UC98_9GAMM|nr:NAD(P)H-binding protein [Ferrimonas lipolytica]QIZ76468.1 NAD(P)H-binding protein [Ferrimonas lipolytica]
MKAVLVAGATGAVGQQLVELLLRHPDEITVHLLSRRATKWQQHPQIIEHILPLNDINKLKVANGVDAVCCCLGTTIKTAGSKAAFTAVDLDAVLTLGAWAKQQQVEQFHVVSSLGVNAKARGFYLQTKYQMEQGLIALGLPSLYIYQPSLLLAPRDEFRLGETVASKVMGLFSWLPKADRWKPIQVEQVATAINANIATAQAGVQYCNSAEIQRISRAK